MTGKVHAHGALLYGEVVFLGSALIERGCTLGHPSAEAVRQGIGSLGLGESLDDLYDRIARPTYIGHGCIVRSGSVIYDGTQIGAGFDCGHNVLIREDVSMGDDVYVKSFTEIMKKVRIGEGCRIAGTIADNSSLGDRVSSFGALTHIYNRRYIPEMSFERGPHASDDVIIGRGAVVVGPITIGRGAVVGANTVVRHDVPEGALIVGPASIRKR